MTLRRLSSSGTNCRCGNARSSGSHSSRTNSSAQSSSFWYSGSVSKSHAIAGVLSFEGDDVVAGDQRGDIAADDLCERAVAVSACGPMPYTFADVHAGEMGQVAHIDMWRQLAVLLRLGEQFAEHIGVAVVEWLAGEDAVLVAVALQDRFDDQVTWVACHRAFEAAQCFDDDRVDLVVLLQQRAHGFLRGAGGQQADLEEHVFLGREIEV